MLEGDLTAVGVARRSSAFWGGSTVGGSRVVSYKYYTAASTSEAAPWYYVLEYYEAARYYYLGTSTGMPGAHPLWHATKWPVRKLSSCILSPYLTTVSQRLSSRSSTSAIVSAFIRSSLCPTVGW